MSTRTRLPRMRRFLSTPSVRRATFLHHFLCHKYYISIHALREEGDFSSAMA